MSATPARPEARAGPPDERDVAISLPFSAADDARGGATMARGRADRPFSRTPRDRTYGVGSASANCQGGDRRLESARGRQSPARRAAVSEIAARLVSWIPIQLTGSRTDLWTMLGTSASPLTNNIEPRGPRCPTGKEPDSMGPRWGRTHRPLVSTARGSTSRHHQRTILVP